MRSILFLLIPLLMLSCSKKEAPKEPVKQAETPVVQTKLVQISSVSQFDSTIATENRLSVVDLYADWCGPCKMIAPTFTKLSGEFSDNANFIKVNVDKHPDLARRYNARSIPLIVFLKNGQVVESVVGVRSENEYRELIQKHI